MVNKEDRIKQLNHVRQIVQRHEDQLNELLQHLNWTKDKLPKQKPKQESEVVANNEIASTSTENTQKETVNQPKDDFDAVVNLCSKISQKQLAQNTFTDINKLRRDLKRRRVKYRTTKSAPLSYTEELRELINLQMDLVTNND